MIETTNSCDGVTETHAPNGDATEATQGPNLECPPELPPVAREESNRIVGELIALSILSKFDRVPLAIYCGAFAIWLEAMQALQTYGTVIKSANGYPSQSPYLTIANKQADIMIRIAGDFGFTPAARYNKFPFAKNNSMLLQIEKDEGNGLAEL